MRSPGPVTPSSSSKLSETPLIRRLQVPQNVYSPNSPMFTQNDQIRIRKQRTDLEIGVAALEQQLSGLRFEARKLKNEMVSESELLALKAEIRSTLSVSNSTKINDLMSVFTETIRDVAAISATCETLDGLIAEETRQREYVVDELASVKDCLDFEGYNLRIPHIMEVELIGKVDPEASRKRRALKEARDGILMMEGNRSCNIEADAALEMARSTEAHWKLKATGTLPVRSEIQRLQRLVSEGESRVRVLENGVEVERVKFDETSRSAHSSEVTTDERTVQAKAEFVRQTESLDHEVLQLKQKVSRSAAYHDKLMAEIAELEADEIERRNQESVDDDEEEDDGDGYEDASRERLIEKRASISSEVKELQARYREGCRRAKDKERRLKSEIHLLMKQCASFKDDEKQFMPSNDYAFTSASSSPIHRQIVSLFQKIDMSIMDLRTELNV